MRYLTVGEVLEIYSQVMEQSGGGVGIHDLGALESAVAQARMTFNGEELYPTIVEKASALGFSLIQNHPFMDGNKRAGHAAMEAFLMLNNYEISAGVDEQVEIVIGVASGKIDRNMFTEWLRNHIVALS
ncbi:MAG TPA: type II toxin-antitoxin system death-on-curing family toxin [Anaerolineales bacterium]|nr:type II toxin-antitoxin system death-on-curing family toxin [Anaerolineales bacterium]